MEFIFAKNHVSFFSLNHSSQPINQHSIGDIIPINQHSIDDIQIKTHQGLGMIPREIRDQGTKPIIAFLLDLFRSPMAEPLFRSKIMTVGYESVGKTTLLDCLFPIMGNLHQYEGKLIGKERKTYFFVLEGKSLMKFKDKESFLSSWQSPQPLEKITLNDREWITIENNEKSEKGLYGILICPIKQDKQKHKIEIFTESQEERERWMVRLRRVCMNEATHGISITNPDMNEHPIVAREMARIREEAGKEAKLELSVWDFAGQHSYYNNHHYFLSTRTVFLVLYRLDQGEKGFKGLSFWIRSLSAYLDPSVCNREFSIFIIGTYLDCLDETQRSRKRERASKVKDVCTENRMNAGFHYFEMSCFTLENVAVVEEAIFSSIFDHTYMGERVPKSYLIVQKAIQELNALNRDLPVVEIQTIIDHCKDQLPLELETVKRALSLLSLWGECVYFPDQPDLQTIAIVNPSFLTKDVLASLFSPANETDFVQGKLKHQDLDRIWKHISLGSSSNLGFWDLAKILMNLMQRFEVCFELEADGDGKVQLPFEERESLFPGYLPSKVGVERSREEKKAWPSDPPFNCPVEIERSILFNVLPLELVSRLLVKLHHLVQDNLVWKNQVILFDPQNDTEPSSGSRSKRTPSALRLEESQGPTVSK